jgi:hypothetical protein
MQHQAGQTPEIWLHSHFYSDTNSGEQKYPLSFFSSRPAGDSHPNSSALLPEVTTHRCIAIKLVFFYDCGEADIWVIEFMFPMDSSHVQGLDDLNYGFGGKRRR